MRSGAEGDMLSRVLPVELELAGVRAPEPLVPVGRCQARHDERAGWDRGLPDLDPLQRYAPACLHRAVVPEQFLDGVGGQGRVIAQERELIRMPQQRECAARDEV